MMTKRDFPPIHPGEVLLEDFLKPMQISQYHLAQAIGVPPRRINEIVHGKRGITADTALRLGRVFGMEAQFWMNLQTRYDLETTRTALADTTKSSASSAGPAGPARRPPVREVATP
jgi:antitoxin HigA-1